MEGSNGILHPSLASLNYIQVVKFSSLIVEKTRVSRKNCRDWLIKQTYNQSITRKIVCIAVTAKPHYNGPSKTLDTLNITTQVKVLLCFSIVSLSQFIAKCKPSL